MAKRIVAKPFPKMMNMNIESIGLAIKAQRTHLGFDLVTASLLCNINKMTLSKIENGSDVKLTTLIMVIEGLGLSIDISGGYREA